MGIVEKYIKDCFITRRFIVGFIICILTFVLAYFLPMLKQVAETLLIVFGILLFVDYLILFFIISRPSGVRNVNDRLSNGDKNSVLLSVRNNSNLPLRLNIIDELPEQLQKRDFLITNIFAPRQQRKLKFDITPQARGEYSFGNLLIYAQSQLGFWTRRFSIEAAEDVKVFPSFINLHSQMLKSNALLVQEQGNRRLRKIGQSMEFEQIKDYVLGDDIRTINWKATARKGSLMVNNYTDEKSQQVFAVIDKGRLMKMPFGGLSLLDYSINSTLALCSVCIQKQDKFGLVTFADKAGTVLPAERNPIQKENVMQALYKEKTGFSESDFEMLYMKIRAKIKQRSLLLLFTNFESLNGLNRQLPYLRSISRHHLLVVIFFENTELTRLANADALTVEDVYVKTIAEKFSYEKRMVVKELHKYGILSVLTSPQGLTANTISKYLEIKARQEI